MHAIVYDDASNPKLKEQAATTIFNVVWPYRSKTVSYKHFLLGHRSLIKKITQTAVINIVFQRIFKELDVSYASPHYVCGLAYETSSSLKMRWNTMFITAVCVIFLIKLRWPKSKCLYDTLFKLPRV